MAGEKAENTAPTKSTAADSPFASILERIGETEVIVKDQREPGGLRRVRLRPLSAAMEAAAHAAFPAATPPLGEDGVPDLSDPQFLVEQRFTQLSVSVGLVCALAGEPVTVPGQSGAEDRTLVYGEIMPGKTLHDSMIGYMRLAAEQHADAIPNEEIGTILDAAFAAASPSGMLQSAGNSSAPTSPKSKASGANENPAPAADTTSPAPSGTSTGPASSGS